jgi:hypothetical protein
LTVIPLRGLDVEDQVPLPVLLERKWSVVSSRQVAAISALQPNNTSLLGNLERIVERLAPDALLFVRRFRTTDGFEWDDEADDRIVAALSMAFLLSPDITPCADAPYPRAIFRSRYKEFCDLPLAFGRERVLAVGHTSRVGVLSVDRAKWNTRIDVAQIDKTVESCPKIIQEVLRFGHLDSRESRLLDGLRIINSSFMGLSQGAMVSSLVSAAEVLVDSQAGDSGIADRAWQRRVARMRVAAGPDCWEVTNRLLEARHRFVHSGMQPPNDLYPFAALALAVQVWGVVEELSRSLGNMQDAGALLDCVADALRLSAQNQTALSTVIVSIPAGPKAMLPWVNHHLTNLPQ